MTAMKQTKSGCQTAAVVAYASVCRVLTIPVPVLETAYHQRNVIKVLIYNKAAKVSEQAESNE